MSDTINTSTIKDDDFQLLTSLRYDPALLSAGSSSPFYLLQFHQDRLLAAAKSFNWPDATVSLQQFTTNDSNDNDNDTPKSRSKLETLLFAKLTSPEIPHRIRILISTTGALTAEAFPLPQPTHSTTPPLLLPKTLPPATTIPQSQLYTILLDKSPTLPSQFTQHKTTHRVLYTEARARVGLPPLPTPETASTEVLLWNEEREIMEGSLSTIYFWREGGWVTPAVRCGGNVGTTRRWALQEGVCIEGVVRLEDVVDGEGVWISTGVRGFVAGRIKLS